MHIFARIGIQVLVNRLFQGQQDRIVHFKSQFIQQVDNQFEGKVVERIDQMDTVLIGWRGKKYAFDASQFVAGGFSLPGQVIAMP
jgi:hypothetical protein